MQPLASQPGNDTEPSIAWGPTLAAALTPLSVGIIIAALALVAYDGLLTRIEKLAGALDRLGAETIDAIALTAPVSSPAITLAHVAARPTGRDDAIWHLGIHRCRRGHRINHRCDGKPAAI